MPHGLLYGASYNNGVLSFTDRRGRTICNADLRKYLTFTATENNSSVALRNVGTVNNTYEYKLNDGAWISYTLTTSGVAIPLNAGYKIQWRCTNRSGTAYPASNYVQFVMTGKIEASNPVTSMVLYTLDPSSLGGYQYACYNLFSGCSALIKAPELPATTLAEWCYYRMFEGCTSLTQAPELPATTLTRDCYEEMFRFCEGLTQAPVLPATTLAEVCYANMFEGCISLAQAPALPATTLAGVCYYQMFKGCISLVHAPALPATTLARRCYFGMFDGCTNLSEIRTYATNPNTDSSNGNVYQWVQGVSTTGDFWCDPNVTWATGVSGIPQNWVRHDIADYTTT